MYQEITDNKDEKKLIELLTTKKLKPEQTNKEGQTPLMIAIDNSFSLSTIS